MGGGCICDYNYRFRMGQESCQTGCNDLWPGGYAVQSVNPTGIRRCIQATAGHYNTGQCSIVETVPYRTCKIAGQQSCYMQKICINIVSPVGMKTEGDVEGCLVGRADRQRLAPPFQPPPPRVTRPAPNPGPLGSVTLAPSLLTYQSRHHAHTFPCMSYNPHWFTK